MKRDKRCVLSICATALLAGCGGSQPPIGVPGAIAQTPAFAAHADRGTSWMLPQAKRKDLLYVTNGDPSGGGTVSVFTYPDGKEVGVLSGFDDPTGSCTDEVGNVFITNANGRSIYEYAHGGPAPIYTLQTADQQPIGCAIDPLTGNLAVGVLGEGVSDVAVYHNARGKPRLYEFASFGDAYYCSYDDAGNLFVDGFSYEHYNNDFQLAELPRGGQTFQVITMKEPIGSPGQIQWYENYLAVGDNENNVIDHVVVQGQTGTIKGQTEFPKDSSLGGFSIVGRRLVDPEDINVELFKYPRGGTNIGTINDDNHPASASVSFVPR
jgi:hypothetical protein